jgi:hypothetical protein
MNILDKIRSIKDLNYTGRCSEKQIKQADNELRKKLGLIRDAVLAGIDGVELSDYCVYKDIAYVDNAVALNKLKTLRESLLSNTGGLSTLGRDVDTRPEWYIDSAGNVEIMVTVALYSILYLCLGVTEILGLI